MTPNLVPNSCDTVVALPSASLNGQVLFGKNSDRPQEEAQPLVQRARASHNGGDAGAQFVQVPQVAETYRHVGSRPFWCAGYEHGFNEHQVVIGNEALPTRLPTAREPKLIGMELLRLGLERARSASEAVEVMTDLTSRFGQGKFENHAGVRTYDNSYIVADPKEAFILEAVGHDWAVKRVQNAASISNVCGLGEDSDRVSATAPQNAANLGLVGSPNGQAFVFSNTFADLAASASGAARRGRTGALLRAHQGKMDPAAMMRILSDHSDGVNPDEPLVTDVSGQLSVCVHRTEGATPGTTAASLVADLCADGGRLPVYWCGLYSPCMTLFLPTFVEGTIPSALSIGGREPSDNSPWWTFYRLTHSGLREGADRRAEIRDAWRSLQAELLESAYEVAAQGRELLDSGDTAEVQDLLTGYMATNFGRAMAKARDLLGSTVGAHSTG